VFFLFAADMQLQKSLRCWPALALVREIIIYSVMLFDAAVVIIPCSKAVLSVPVDDGWAHKKDRFADIVRDAVRDFVP